MRHDQLTNTSNLRVWEPRTFSFQEGSSYIVVKTRVSVFVSPSFCLFFVLGGENRTLIFFPMEQNGTVMAAAAVAAAINS